MRVMSKIISFSMRTCRTRNKCDFALAVSYFVLYIPVAICRFSTEPTSPKDISCYDKQSTFLPVIDKKFRPPHNIIYFIESSCNGELRSRYTCTVESAARANPNWHVAILFTGPLQTEFLKSKTFKLLSSIPNLFFYRIYPKNLATGTSLEKIFVKNILATSRYPAVHASDLIRLLVLYLFGGLYLDLDMMVLRSFDNLPRNFIAHQDRQSIAAAIIAVANDEVGKKFANISITDVAENYDRFTWAANANEIYRRTLAKMCVTDYNPDMTSENCQGFHVLDFEPFYPHLEKYYERQSVPMPSDYKQVYTHHMWNSWGQRLKIEHNSLFSDLASMHCPKTFNLYMDKFGE